MRVLKACVLQKPDLMQGARHVENERCGEAGRVCFFLLVVPYSFGSGFRGGRNSLDSRGEKESTEVSGTLCGCETPTVFVSATMHADKKLKCRYE